MFVQVPGNESRNFHGYISKNVSSKIEFMAEHDLSPFMWL